MVNKKVFLTFISLILIFIVAGCSDKSSGEGQSEDGVVTIDFWSAESPGSKQDKAIKEQISKFEKEHPKIKINQQSMTYDMMYDNLITAINAGNTPDISWGLSEWFGEFNSFDALLDLTPYIEEWEDKDQIYENVMTSLTVQGKVKAIPNYLGIRALLYNKEILSEAGYDAPPETWDELLEMGPKIHKETGKYAFGISATGVRSGQELLTFLAQNDVYIAEEMSDGKFKNTWNDNPDQLKRVAETFEFYSKMLEQGVVSPNAKSWGWQEEDDNFSLGQYAMVENGTWIKDTITTNGKVDMKDIGVAAPPHNGNPATFLEVSPFYVYKSTKYPDETWEFAKFMLSKEFQSAVNPDNAPRRDLAGQDEFAKGFSDLTTIGVTFPQVSMGTISNAMIDSLGKVLQKDEDPKKVASWLSDQINKSLKNNGEFSEE